MSCAVLPREEQFLDALRLVGWVDPKLAGRSYIIVPSDEGPRGIALRYKPGGPRKAQMSSICLTTHANGGVSLMAPAKAGASARRGNTVETYICSDLACSLYVRKQHRCVSRPNPGLIICWAGTARPN
ncbi:FBP domain-containing protein [Rhodococcus fascians]|nr:FBP domain-containing protein [Rhodococcus fascians]